MAKLTGAEAELARHFGIPLGPTMEDLIAERLGLGEDEMRAVFYADGFRGIRGYEVAAALRRRFGLRPEERLGRGLWRRGVLPRRLARYLDVAVWADAPAAMERDGEADHLRRHGLLPAAFRWE
jgi:hypothetical protein